jgi:putative redox protein
MNDARVLVQMDQPDFRMTARAGRHELVSDEPLDAGGGDTGPTPKDLLLASLGACTIATMKMYANRKGWPLTGATVRMNQSTVNGRLVIEKRIHIEGPLSDEQRDRILAISKVCPVSRALENGATIESTVE